MREERISLVEDGYHYAEAMMIRWQFQVATSELCN